MIINYPTLNDWDILEQIKRLVQDCFNNWEIWRYRRDTSERDYTIATIDQAYRALRSIAFKERAIQEIAKHSRLHVVMLKRWGVYIDF